MCAVIGDECHTGHVVCRNREKRKTKLLHETVRNSCVYVTHTTAARPAPCAGRKCAYDIRITHAHRRNNRKCFIAHQIMQRAAARLYNITNEQKKTSPTSNNNKTVMTRWWWLSCKYWRHLARMHTTKGIQCLAAHLPKNENGIRHLIFTKPASCTDSARVFLSMFSLSNYVVSVCGSVSFLLNIRQSHAPPKNSPEFLPPVPVACQT